MELKKRQEEKLILIEQKKAEKNAEREKKIVNIRLSKNRTLDYSRTFCFSAREIHGNCSCKRK